jgi:hypothetical protein
MFSRTPWCCSIAAFEGYERQHAQVCPYRQEPQTSALFALSAPETTEGEPQP